MNSREKSEIRELTIDELNSVSGGRSVTLDFGIVSIDMIMGSTYPGNWGNGPASAASICGTNGCLNTILGP